MQPNPVGLRKGICASRRRLPWKARLELPNEEMCNALLGTLEEQGYVLDETYTLDGNMVSFAY